MTYESPSATAADGGIIKVVEPGGPADRAGLAPGQVVVAANGRQLTDVLAWMWESDDDSVDIVLGSGQEVTLERNQGEPWGIDFQDALFDGVRRCRNECSFCFMTQLPKGLRPSLYLRDDDYRLSFLQGNFVTLTNLTDEDVDRIIDERISPLHLSFHAVDETVRRQLIGRNHEEGLTRFEELTDAGIEFHVQIVLVPGVNDAEQLDATLAYLGKRRPQVLTVGLVPVAHTDHGTLGVNGVPLEAGASQPCYTDQLDAARVIQHVQRYQFESRAETEETWVHLADEFYINAHAPFPLPEWYDGFPQYENGIGIVVNFAQDVRENFEALSAGVAAIPAESDAATVVIGELATGTMLGALSALQAGGRVRVLPVRNRFFGGNLSVTGLLTGQDIARAVAYDAEHCAKPSTYLVPDIIFNVDGVTLDGMTADHIAAESGAPVRFVETSVDGLLSGLVAVGEESK